MLLFSALNVFQYAIWVQLSKLHLSNTGKMKLDASTVYFLRIRLNLF